MEIGTGSGFNYCDRCSRCWIGCCLSRQKIVVINHLLLSLSLGMRIIQVFCKCRCAWMLDIHKTFLATVLQCCCPACFLFPPFHIKTNLIELHIAFIWPSRLARSQSKCTNYFPEMNRKGQHMHLDPCWALFSSQKISTVPVTSIFWTHA